MLKQSNVDIVNYPVNYPLTIINTKHIIALKDKDLLFLSLASTADFKNLVVLVVVVIGNVLNCA